MRENRSSVASEAPTLPAGLPSVSTASEWRSPAHSAPNRTATSMKEPCSCGCTDYQLAHFVAGRLFCETCWAGREPAVAMPPTRLEQLLLEQWIASLNRGARP